MVFPDSMNIVTEKNPSQVLTGVVSRLSMVTSLDEITSVVAEAARALADSDGATFVLRDQNRCYYVDEDAVSPLWKGKKFPLDTCISGWSMIHRETVVIQDIYQDSRIPRDAYRPTFVKSLCMIPIRIENPIGAIGIYWAHERIPTGEEVKLLQVLANSTAVALENLELKHTIREKSSELETAIHSMAHDLRAPVAAMTGLAELLRLHLVRKPDEKIYDYVQCILDTGKRAAEQIEQMLALYRITTGSVEKEEVNISEMAERIMKQLRLRFPNHSIDFQSAPDLRANCDPRLIEIVFENLLSNAVKYSSKKPQSQIRVGCMKDGNLSIFFVQDNGVGFDQTQVVKLFRPLSRLHGEVEFDGTGLGLASAARIVEAHGGHMRAEGRKSEGATFYLTLPS